jgi:hypothetical protein
MRPLFLSTTIAALINIAIALADVSRYPPGVMGRDVTAVMAIDLVTLLSIIANIVIASTMLKGRSPSARSITILLAIALSVLACVCGLSVYWCH